MMATRPGAASASPQATPPASPKAPAEQQPVHDTEVMCRYPSKKCWNARALKRNGERHNLCDFHRQKANKNQRRLELKRKARAQASADAESGGKRLRAHKKPRQRARRAPLSAHLAMKEEARAKQQAEAAAAAAAAAASAAFSGLGSWQDLVLLDGVYDREGFPQVKQEVLMTTELQRLPDEEVLDRILQDGQADVGALCKSLDTTAGLEALAALPEGKTSPVDVGESWDNLDFSDYWVSSMPADQPAASFDAAAFVVDEDVFVADV
ncbi:hypothetical protein PHYSODRAFT_353564 [Phytophthora sojae]|uniref:Uncharacterized protein n=1 Tax=Phytophthora sojae (strain P6497) TaxID=1094619 RepID=G4YMJ3_PHYSP|nr:hypothetical protein PHYSODRAFT_353564 [Phytophthora sojae]EGZ28619.1 hypothetical protein PHYSODRAFT_353564 [Phytophthora sojae]|eukprot:XP_009515894.1 hypothetical protein PHYSODRAFT_353564 [Phytophthora sojae]